MSVAVVTPPPPPPACLFFLPPQALAPDVPFISTNDVLASSYFRSMSTPVGFMLLNCRDRIEGLSRDHAGNYQSVIAFQVG
jgi:hypothetical protein